MAMGRDVIFLLCSSVAACLWKGMRLAQVQVQCKQGLQMQKALMADTLFPFP